MTEREFWSRLEFRVCRELAGMEDRALRFLWCDGFIAEEYLVDDPAPRITGRAWICQGTREDPWAFTLVLGQPARALDEIQWETLLPPDGVTAWLVMDLVAKQIRLSPFEAVVE